MHQKRQKLQTVPYIQGQIEAFFICKLNLPRDESSPKRQIRPVFLRSCNILVHETQRYFDDN